MSGIEIAGLVLGAFPLLIHALESYREGAEVLEDWWRFQTAYKECKHEIKYHCTIFQENIERLLLPLVVDDDELKGLIDDPAGDAWEDEELEKMLKQRLPKSYSLFLDIMNNINRLMESLKRELGVLQPQANVDKHGNLNKTNISRQDQFSIPNIKFQARRIRFSLKKSSRKRLFTQLEDANGRLTNLLDSKDKISEARRSREANEPNSAASRKINEFWKHARRLHGALSKSWLCNCANHVANLQLRHRTSEQVEFDVLFNVGLTPERISWQDTKIKMLPGDIVDNAVGITINEPRRTPAKGTRQVRWAGKSDQAPQPLNQINTKKIDCLCNTLSQNCCGCFGFLDEDDHRFIVYPGDQAVSVTGPEIVTLEKLLYDSHDVLTRRKRYWLALTLASSYLQLCSTPWLPTHLRKDTILFLRDPSSNDSLLLESPYICGDMSKKGATDAKDTMAALGIRLLELCFGTALEHNKFRQQLGPGDATTAPLLDYAAAVNWSKMVNEEAGPEFAGAVEWCLRTQELSDGKWRKDIWTQVIGPLEYCHRQVSQRLAIY